MNVLKNSYNKENKENNQQDNNNNNNNNNNIAIKVTDHTQDINQAAAVKEGDSTDSLNGMQLKNNQISLSTSNMKSEHNTEHNSSEGLNESLTGTKSLGNIKASQEEKTTIENDADVSKKLYHPTIAPINIINSNNRTIVTLPSPTYNDTYPITPLTSKCKSNIENVRKHSEESFYGINTCPLVSTSLNRLNYLPIKNDDLYEYLARDNDNITPAIANEIAQTPTTPSNRHFEKLKDGPTGSSLAKEKISVASFNQDEDNKKEDIEMPSPEMLSKNCDKDQHYPSNVMNLAQKNRENSVISFLSPLSTPTQPIFSVPPPPPNNPPVV